MNNAAEGPHYPSYNRSGIVLTIGPVGHRHVGKQLRSPHGCEHDGGGHEPARRTSQSGRDRQGFNTLVHSQKPFCRGESRSNQKPVQRGRNKVVDMLAQIEFRPAME